MNPFAARILAHKYAHLKQDGSKETWAEVAHRVSKHVMKAVNAPKSFTKAIEKAIVDRKFVPGGRYLYAAGRPYHQTQNCLLLRAEDSREGWSDLMYKSCKALMTGAGIGIDYSLIRAKGKPIRKTGGQATGPCALMEMINCAGRGIQQGGSRRSAIWAGLSWKHPDIHEFITLKNWIPEVRALKLKDFNFPAAMDGTNISVQLDEEFFKAYHDERHAQHSLANGVYWTTIKQMLKTGEPGFSIDVGSNSKETLRNACVSGDTEILTDKGYVRIEEREDLYTRIWNGFEWSEVLVENTGLNREMIKVTLSDGRSLTCTLDHKFVISTDYKGSTKRVEARELNKGDKLIKHLFPVLEGGFDTSWAYTQGFISGDGMDDYSHMMIYGDKISCISRMDVRVGAYSSTQDRTYVSFNFDPLPKSFVPLAWSQRSKLDWLSGLIDSDGTRTLEGGCQIASVNIPFLLGVQKLLSTLGTQSKVCDANVEGLRIMPDGRGGKAAFRCQETKRLLIGATQIQTLLALGMRTERVDFEAAPQRDAARFVTVISVECAGVADKVYCFTEPKRNLGCFNGIITGQCTEITSSDDSDICNLGSINMARIESIEDFNTTLELATSFLLAGTVYSDVPYPQVDQVRTKNRRLGLGLMGIHEWLLKRGKKYGPDTDLDTYLVAYALSGKIAKEYADKWDLSTPVKTRAIAPTGTIAIISETTSGMEPVFCASYKRRYLKGTTWNYEYVVDPIVKQLVDGGMDPDKVEDAYSIDPERRVSFQANLQQYVDHAISSTINIPAWGSESNNESTVQQFGTMLIKYLPKLRGITCYPDGARGGQPLSPVKWTTAMKNTGEVFEEQGDICDIKGGGSCGS